LHISTRVFFFLRTRCGRSPLPLKNWLRFPDIDLGPGRLGALLRYIHTVRAIGVYHYEAELEIHWSARSLSWFLLCTNAASACNAQKRES